MTALEADGRSSIGLDILTCDPMLELVYQAGVLPLKDMRTLMACLDSKELDGITKEQARDCIQRWAGNLQDLVVGSEVCAQRVRTLVWDLENRMANLEVPLWAVHPTLETPLVSGQLAPMALYDELMGVGQALRLMTHPAAWGQVHTNIWDTMAASASLSMKPCLALILATIIPVEARLSYVTLRHAAYADTGVATLGQMVTNILCKMMTYAYGPKDLHKVSKHLRQVGPALSPFTLFIMRTCRTCTDQRLDRRAEEKQSLEARLSAFLEEQGDKALYCRKVWTRFLLDLDLRFLAAFYIKFLYDGFQ